MKLDGIGSTYFAEFAFQVAAFGFAIWTLSAFFILEDLRGYTKMGPKNLVVKEMFFVSYRNLISLLVLLGLVLEIFVGNFFAENPWKDSGSGAKF